jgi:hypothetical protein
MGSLNPVAESDRFDSAVLIAGPGIHGHRVCVVEKESVWFGYFPNVTAELKQDGNGPLGIEQTTRPKGVSNALIDAVSERNVDVGLEGPKPSLADHADDVIGVGDGFTGVGAGFDFSRELVGLDVTTAKLLDHFQVARVNVHQGEGGILQFGNCEDIPHETTGEANGTGTEESNFDRHKSGKVANRFTVVGMI